MNLKLKNVERTFKVTTPPTERTANSASEKFWVLAFGVNENLTTDEIETYFAPENMSEIIFSTTLVNGTECEHAVSGYTKRLSSFIKHLEDGNCVIELQFSKEAGTTDEGSVANG